MRVDILYTSSANGKLYRAWSGNPINVQWNQRYYVPGDFAIQFTQDDYYGDGKDSFTPSHVMMYHDSGRMPELGIIQKTEKVSEISGDFVNIYGMLAEEYTLWPLVNTLIVCNNSNLSAFARARADTYLVTGKHPIITRPAAANVGGNALFNLENQSLGQALGDEMKKQEMAQYLDIVEEYDGTLFVPMWSLAYKIRIGDDHTTSQSTLEIVDFAPDGLMANRVSIIADDSAYLNFAYVSYGAGLTTSVDRRGANERTRGTYITSTVNQAAGQTDANYLLAVKADANSQLDQHLGVNEFEVEVRTDFLHNSMMADYFCGLGWKVNVGSYQTRITEINHVWKDNGHTATVRLGELQYRPSRR